MPTPTAAAGAYAAIQGLSGPGAGAVRRPAGAEGASGGFGQMLSGLLDGVEGAGRKADAQATRVATGRADVVDVVTAVAESETALETLVAVRDRVISAYEDIMRMPV